MTLEEYVEFTELWRQSAWTALEDEDIKIDKLHPYTGFVLPFARRDDTGEDLRYPWLRLDVFEELPGLGTANMKRHVKQFTKPDEMNKDIWDAVVRAKVAFRLPDVIGDGERHTTLFSYAGYLRARGLDAKAILRDLIRIDKQRCDPPLSDTKDGINEIVGIASRVASEYEAGSRTPTVKPKPQPKSEPSLWEDPDSDGDGEDEEFVDESIDAFKRFKLRKTEEQPTFYDSSEVTIAEWCSAEITDYDDELIYDQGVLRLYNRKIGIWEEVYSPDVLRLVYSLDGCVVHKGSGADGNPILDRLTVGNRQSRDIVATLNTLKGMEGVFKDIPGGLAFNNGFVQLDKYGWKLKPKSKHNLALSYIDTEFTEDVETPKFDAFLDYIMVGADKDEKVRLIWEAMGISLACLGTDMQKAFLLVGHGANGKSKLLDIWTATMPKGRVTSVSPQDFSHDYKLAMLKNSLLNAVNEAPDSEIANSANVKAVISGDKLTARPIREAPFEFACRALQVFACNELPGYRDLTGGFERRWLILKFDRFIPQADRNPNVAKEIIAAELNAIICKALICAAEAVKRGSYIEPPSSVAARKLWTQDNNHVLDFIENNCEDTRTADRTGPLSGTTSRNLHARYMTWCVSAHVSDKHSLSKRKLDRTFAALGYPPYDLSGETYIPLLYTP
jgi:P4 family phage/plasmid primase-like protien